MAKSTFSGPVRSLAGFIGATRKRKDHPGQQRAGEQQESDHRDLAELCD